MSDCQYYLDGPGKNEDGSDKEGPFEVLEALKLAMCSNTTLGKYDIKHNTITDDGIAAIVEVLGLANHVSMVTMSEFISEDAMNMLTEALAQNKPAKGGKKGGKKKK